MLDENEWASIQPQSRCLAVVELILDCLSSHSIREVTESHLAESVKAFLSYFMPSKPVGELDHEL